MLSDEAAQTPAVARLEDAKVVAEGDELRGYAAQEVRVAVIPIRDERVGEDYEANASLRFSSVNR